MHLYLWVHFLFYLSVWIWRSRNLPCCLAEGLVVVSQVCCNLKVGSGFKFVDFLYGLSVQWGTRLIQTAKELAKFCVQGTLRKYMSVSLDKQKCVHFQSIKIVMKRGWDGNKGENAKFLMDVKGKFLTCIPPPARPLFSWSVTVGMWYDQYQITCGIFHERLIYAFKHEIQGIQHSSIEVQGVFFAWPSISLGEERESSCIYLSGWILHTYLLEVTNGEEVWARTLLTGGIFNKAFVGYWNGFKIYYFG